MPALVLTIDTEKDKTVSTMQSTVKMLKLENSKLETEKTEKKKRQDLSLKEKISIIEQYDELPKMSQRNAAVQLKVSQPVLCKILKNRKEIEDAAKSNHNLNTKRNRSGKDDQLETALKHWFTEVREHDIPVDNSIIRQKAKELAMQMGKDDFVVTEGWFRRWKNRENIVYEQTHNQQIDSDWTNQWSDVAQCYTANNIYNVEETTLYYRALSEHTYMFRKESATGCNALKEHVTVLCCANMSGEKEKLLVIGKWKNPRSFKGIKSLPVHYYSNSNACMTSLIFNEWLMKWDNALDRKIALLVYNCTARTVNFHPRNIKVTFIPPDITLQDRGMISSLKANYRKELRARVLENTEEMKCTADGLAKKVDLLQAVHLIAMSWHLVTETTIKNCFKYNRFSEECIEGEHLNGQQPEVLSSMFQEWMAMDQNVTERLTEENICEVVMPVENDELDEEQHIEALQPPTHNEMRAALKVLRRGVQHRASDFQMQYQYETFINSLLREPQRQTTLDEFFSCSFSS